MKILKRCFLFNIKQESATFFNHLRHIFFVYSHIYKKKCICDIILVTLLFLFILFILHGYMIMSTYKKNKFHIKSCF